MAQPISFNSILSTVKNTVEGVSDICKFDKTPGGPSPWVIDGVPRFHWWGAVMRTKNRISTNPGSLNTMTARRDCWVTIEGWYPKISAANSDATWREMLESVTDALEAKMFLGLNVGVFLEDGPNIVEDGEAAKTSLNQGDLPMLCHYCRLSLKYVQEYSFTTQ